MEMPDSAPLKKPESGRKKPDSGGESGHFMHDSAPSRTEKSPSRVEKSPSRTEKSPTLGRVFFLRARRSMPGGVLHCLVMFVEVLEVLEVSVVSFGSSRTDCPRGLTCRGLMPTPGVGPPLPIGQGDRRPILPRRRLRSTSLVALSAPPASCLACRL